MLNSAGMDAQFERSCCAISRGILNRFGRLLFGSRIKVRMKSDFQVLLEQAKAEMENIRREEERQKAEKERRDLQAENKMQDRDRSGFLR